MPARDPSEPVDQKYYQVAPPRSLLDRLVIKAGAEIYRDCLRLCRPTRLDNYPRYRGVGCGGEIAQMWERLYPYPARITVLILGDA